MTTSNAPYPKSSAWLGLLLVATVPSIGVFFAIVFPPTAGTVLGQGIFGAAKVWILILPLIWLITGRTRGDGLKPHRHGLGAGALLGGLIAATIVAAYATFAHAIIPVAQMREAVAHLGLGQPIVYTGFALYTIMINAWLEEYVWRWFVFRQCEALMPPLVAVITSALLFTGHHTLAMSVQTTWPVTLLVSVGVFLGGCAWSWLYLRYRSIWPGYISHVIVDVAVFAIGWMILFNGT
jgi:membrane protease YdiL (CAAX protease family)